MNRTLVIFLICTMIVVRLGAEIENEVSGYRFLNIENSAKIFGMGSAGVSLPAGVSSVSYNPASLSFIQKFEFASSYKMLFADLKYESFDAGGLSLYNDKGDERIVLSAFIMGGLQICGTNKSKPYILISELLGMPYIKMHNRKGEEIWNAPYHNKIIAKEFILADELYRERAIWTVGRNGVDLLFRDEDQNGRILLSIAEGNASLSISDENMTPRIIIGSTPEVAGIAIMNKNNKIIWTAP